MAVKFESRITGNKPVARPEHRAIVKRHPRGNPPSGMADRFLHKGDKLLVAGNQGDFVLEVVG